MDEDKLQASVLKKFLYNQKLCIQDKEFLKKLTLVLCSDNEQYYRKKLKELSVLFNVSEMLIMSKKFHYALRYISMVKYVIKKMNEQMDKDFGKISKQI